MTVNGENTPGQISKQVPDIFVAIGFWTTWYSRCILLLGMKFVLLIVVFGFVAVEVTQADRIHTVDFKTINKKVKDLRKKLASKFIIEAKKEGKTLTEKDAEKKAASEILVVADFDDTLFWDPSRFGPRSFRGRIASLFDFDGDRQYRYLSDNLSATSEDMREVVNGIQEEGHPFLILSGRPRAELERTTRSALRKRGINYQALLLIGRRGDKGWNLVNYLKRTGKNPKHIVFIDDRSYYLDSVKEAMKKDSDTGLTLFHFGQTPPATETPHAERVTH